MKLAAKWRSIEADLPADWADARLELAVGNDAQLARAAALLGPANPGRKGSTLVFQASRRGVGIGPDAVERLLARLDTSGIRGTLTPLDSTAAEPVAPLERLSLADGWDAELAALPPDWSDVYAELAAKFPAFVDVLAKVRKRIAIAENNQVTDVGKLYEIWLRTREEWVEQKLKQAGVLVDPGTKVIQ